MTRKPKRSMTAKEQEYDKEVGSCIYELRTKYANMTQDELAKEIDTTTPTIYKYEYGEISVPMHRLMTILEVINKRTGKSIDIMITREGACMIV